MRLTRLYLSLIAFAVASQASDGPLPVTIYSRKAPDYDRELDAKGNPAREYYAIGYGGRIDGTIWDQGQEKENFPSIAGTIAEELAKQNYHFAEAKEDADLLIVLHWGRTNPFDTGGFTDGINIAGEAYRQLENVSSNFDIPPTDGGISLVSAQQTAVADANAQLDSALALVQMENRMQDRRDEETARVLGYTDELNRNNDIARFAGSDRYDLLLNDVHDPRYYVVVTAYDFEQITQNTKKRKPLPRWVTRFSIRTRGNNFMASVDEMALRAGKYFGRDSGRLIRDYNGDVQIGELQVVGTVPDDPPDEE